MTPQHVSTSVTCLGPSSAPSKPEPGEKVQLCLAAVVGLLSDSVGPAYGNAPLLLPRRPGLHPRAHPSHLTSDPGARVHGTLREVLCGVREDGSKCFHMLIRQGA